MRSAADPESAEFAGVYLGLAKALLKLERIDDALPYLRRAHASLKNAYGSASIETAYAEAALGDALLGRGDEEAALVHHRHALDAVVQHPDVGPNHRRAADFLHNLARTLAAMDRYADALEYAQRAVSVGTAAYGSGHLAVAGKEALAGAILIELGRFDGALASLQRAHATYEAALPADHPALLQARQSLADVYLRQEEFSRAFQLLEHLLEAFVRLQGNGTQRVARTRFQLAQAAWGVGQHPRALELARAAADEYRALGAANADRAATVTAWLADHQGAAKPAPAPAADENTHRSRQGPM